MLKVVVHVVAAVKFLERLGICRGVGCHGVAVHHREPRKGSNLPRYQVSSPVEVFINDNTDVGADRGRLAAAALLEGLTGNP